MDKFAPWTKIDVNRRVVTVEVGEVVDRAREVFDYDASKPHVLAWSKTVADASEGKSLGNVRAMHDPTHAAGRVLALTPMDDVKKFAIDLHIVDDQDWEKVLTGVYTGTSWGGRYAKKWYDPQLQAVRYAGAPSEISLVDLPCAPDAKFKLTKADGTEEEQSFKKILTADQIADVEVPIEASLAKADEPEPTDDEDEDDDTKEEMAKVLRTTLDDWKKSWDDALKTQGTEFTGKLDTLQKSLNEAQEAAKQALELSNATVADLSARLKKMEDAPLPGGPVLRADGRGAEDASTAKLTKIEMLETLQKSATDQVTKQQLEKMLQLEAVKDALAKPAQPLARNVTNS